MGVRQDRRELVAAVRAHASNDPTSAAALADLRELEVVADFHDPEPTAAAGQLHQARMSALPEAERGTDFVATVVLFSFVTAAAPALVPASIGDLLRRTPLPPPALGLIEWASLTLDDAAAARDRAGVEHALMLANRAAGTDGFADARLLQLDMRARGHQALYRWTDDPDDLDDAIAHWREYANALALAESDYAAAWSNLGVALDNRGTRTRSDEDLTEAIECAQRAVDHAPDPALRARFLSNLASALNARHAPGDGEPAIQASREAVTLTAVDDPDRPIRLTNLGSALGAGYRRTSQLALLEESIAVFREAVALTQPGDPKLQTRQANLATALAAVPAPDPPAQHSRPPPWRSLTNGLSRRVVRSRLWSRGETWLHRFDHRIGPLEYRFSAYLRHRPVPNLARAMSLQAIGGPVAGDQAAAALPPPLLGLEDIVRSAGDWCRRWALWTAAGVVVVAVVLHAAKLSWGAAAVAVVLGVGIDLVLIGRGHSVVFALRFCPVAATVFTAVIGAGFVGLATLVWLASGVDPTAAALASVWGWATMTTAVIKPAIAPELAFSRGERRTVQLPPAEGPGGVGMMRVRKDSVIPMFAGPFDDEFEVLPLDRPGSADSGPRRVQALSYAWRSAREALAVASLVGAVVAVITAIFLIVASQLSLGFALLCSLATGLVAGTERLRLMVEPELRADEVAEGRAPRPSVSLSPIVAGRFARFGGRGPLDDSLLTTDNHPTVGGQTAAGLRPSSDEDEVWE